MPSDEKIVRVETLDEFDRELSRDGGEALEVPASLAEQYGLFPEDVGSEDEIRGRRQGIRTAPRRRKTDEARRISPPVRRRGSSSRSAREPPPGRSPGGRASACFPPTSTPDGPTREATACTWPPSQQARGYADVRWGTYRQIQARGGQVRKGEHEHPYPLVPGPPPKIRPDRRPRDGPSGTRRGKRVYRYERLPTPVVRQYNVFNAEQVDGLPARPTPTAEPLWKVHQNAERVLEDSGVPVRHVAGDRAFYNLNRDEIVLPERVQFPSANHYYQTALHELGHSTGHPERMNRPTLTEGIELRGSDHRPTRRRSCARRSAP